MRIVNSIDKDRNGYVTSTELDDIIKMVFSVREMVNLKKDGMEEVTSLDGFDTKPLLRPFASSANRVLIDYKRFRDFLVKGVAKLNYEKKQRENREADQRKSRNETPQLGDPLNLKRTSELVEDNLEAFRKTGQS